ncbi:MAG: hypothetical protein J2P48_06815, partial [Alphaproteobacteria bacterium]|nr:hypothetical protein [Alphaproteobacteria bacterium]
TGSAAPLSLVGLSFDKPCLPTATPAPRIGESNSDMFPPPAVSRHLRGRVFAGLLSAGLAACAQGPPAESPAQPGVTAVAPEAPLPRFIGVIGPEAQHAPPFLGVPGTNYYRLRSFIDRKTGETLHQLYISDSYSGEQRDWNAARDEAGRPLRFIEISRNEISCEGGCSYLEEFVATIPEAELRADPQGLTVIFTARSGAEKRVSISAAQIAAQLAAVDARRNPVRRTSQPAPQPPSAHQ